MIRGNHFEAQTKMFSLKERIGKFTKSIFCFFGILLLSIHSSGQENEVELLKQKLKITIHDTTRVNILNTLGEKLMRQSDLTNAFNYVKEAMALSEKYKYSEGSVDASINLGRIYLIKGDFEEAFKQANLAFLKSKNSKYKTGIAKAYNLLGIYYGYQGAYNDAKKNFQLSINTYKELRDNKGYAGGLNNLGHVYLNQGLYPEALKIFLESLKITEEFKEPHALANLYENIGNIYNTQEEDSIALQYYNKALEIGQKNNLKGSIGNAYINIADIYMHQGKFKESYSLNYTALNIFKEIGDDRNISIINENMGVALQREAIIHLHAGENKLAENKFLEAITHHQIARDFNEKYGDEEGLATSYLNLGSTYILLRRVDSAKMNLQKALPIFSKNSSIDGLKGTYEYLSVADSMLGNFKSAYFNHLKYILYRDSINSKEKTKEIVQSQMKYEFDRKKAETDLAHALELNKSEKRNNRIIFISSLLILSAIFSFLYIREKNQKRREIEKNNAVHKMSQLELQSLRAQLNPHFMFNSLNAIQELILKQENEKSQSYLERFAHLLRTMLENANQPFIPLRKEIDFLKLYLSLEQLRIPDLQYSVNIDPSIDPDKVQTPNMMLQPYLENALWHGLQYKAGEKKLELNITKGNGRVNFQVKDNGIGRKKASELKSAFQKAHKSKGMELLSKRFSLLSKEYGEDITTDIADISENGESAGTAVLISVPASLTHQRETIAS